MKHKRYWLRGLLIGVLFIVAISLIPRHVIYAIPGLAVITRFFYSVGMPLGNLFAWLNCGEVVSGSGSWCGVGPGLAGYFITYPVLGSLIGWLYGKIKNRSN